MAVRLKTKWHSSRRRRSRGAKTLEDRASVVGVAVWKIAFNTFRHMEDEEFGFASDRQIMDFLNEMICFLVQVCDRSVYGQIGEAERREFMLALAHHLAKTVESNYLDISGPGKHGQRFVDLLNQRVGEYAEFEFNPGSGEGYGFRRYLGERLGRVMAASDSKWVLEHVMEIEVPEALKLLRRTINESMGLALSS
ncbi:MAG: hypothetical protein LJE84_14050 [Gammaproteobacteria bacterium]|nr:hypothetical protein [Gammaproteobacteria bacterium]